MTETTVTVQGSLQKQYNAMQKQVLLCYQCSKCNSVCPAFRIGEYSPRNFILTAVNEGIEEASRDKSIWSCKTCYACEICPMSIDIPGTVLLARIKAINNGNLPPASKSGHRRIFSIAQKIQASSTVLPIMNKWPLGHQRFSDKGSIALYTGLVPVWDNLLYNYDLNFVTGMRAILEAMNLVGVEPAIPVGMKDSGHDAYYGGDEATFMALAKYNRDAIEKLGSKTLVVANPEDYHTLKCVYPKYGGDLPVEIVFWTDFLVENGFTEMLQRQIYLDTEVVVAYHDPCKLGRLSKIYNSPRAILKSLPFVKITKFSYEKELAPCCGVTAFIGCNDGSLYLRHERLKEACDLGVDVVVSTCPSCVTHYKCALASLMPSLRNSHVKELEVSDLATFMGTRLFHLDKKPE
ncbi:MAG TPA: (Fe-S)-binding protein [Candidatus Lokiarchaeia archaeon]|nr:(Fe-S)-binding protein [Candidatus Lokiarchaeia archaeon]